MSFAGLAVCSRTFRMGTEDLTTDFDRNTTFPASRKISWHFGTNYRDSRRESDSTRRLVRDFPHSTERYSPKPRHAKRSRPRQSRGPHLTAQRPDEDARSPRKAPQCAG